MAKLARRRFCQERAAPGGWNFWMNVKVGDLMTEQVLVARPHHTVSHLREMMGRNGIHAIPVVNGPGEPVGIVALLR